MPGASRRYIFLCWIAYMAFAAVYAVIISGFHGAWLLPLMHLAGLGVLLYDSRAALHAENIGVRSETFDYVMATEVLEHLPHPEKALAEIRRVAKKKAPVILSVPYEPYFHIGNICRGKHLYRGGRTPSHLHFWHRKEFRDLITPYVRIEKECTFATFPWLLYLCTCK